MFLPLMSQQAGFDCSMKERASELWREGSSLEGASAWIKKLSMLKTLSRALATAIFSYKEL